MRPLLLCLVSLFCVTCLVACENNAPAGQLTVVQGTVTSADTGRPLRGVLMAIEDFSPGFNGVNIFTTTRDSVRTDALGTYRLSFRNQKGLSYAVTLDQLTAPAYRLTRYVFVTNPNSTSGTNRSDSQKLTLGQANVVDFKPNEVRTVAVRIRNRNTGYQRLDFNSRYLPGNTLDTLAYLRFYYLPPTDIRFHYYRVNAAGAITKDTTVALVVQNPGSLPPDTLRATLTFVR